MTEWITTHTHTHTHITSGRAGCELHAVGFVCCGDVNVDPLGQIYLLCILRQHDIYLLELDFHPVAVFFTLVHDTQQQNIRKEKEYRSQNTPNRKQNT
jgi:hypothetical protein